jgi:hypothetical protein
MRLQINDARTRLQIGSLDLALQRHAMLSLICLMVRLTWRASKYATLPFNNGSIGKLKSR